QLPIGSSGARRAWRLGVSDHSRPEHFERHGLDVPVAQHQRAADHGGFCRRPNSGCTKRKLRADPAGGESSGARSHGCRLAGSRTNTSMPGNLLAAVPNGVMPFTLCVSFTEEREYAQLQNQYMDGTIQRSQLAQTSRRTFKIAKRLS